MEHFYTEEEYEIWSQLFQLIQVSTIVKSHFDCISYKYCMKCKKEEEKRYSHISMIPDFYAK